MHRVHRASALVALLIALVGVACPSHAEPTPESALIDKLLVRTASAKDPFERKRLTSELVDHCAFPPAGRALGLSGRSSIA